MAARNHLGPLTRPFSLLPPAFVAGREAVPRRAAWGTRTLFFGEVRTALTEGFARAKLVLVLTQSEFMNAPIIKIDKA